MHSIERYGIVALLFLVVTVVAVLMWDGGKGKKKEALAGSATTAAVQPRERAGTADRRAARRLALAAEPQPGPLVRQPDQGAGGPIAEPASQPAGDLNPGGAPLDLGGAMLLLICALSTMWVGGARKTHEELYPCTPSNATA